MAINIQYGVDPMLLARGVGQAAGQAATSEQQFRYDQLGENRRQFDTEMQYRADMAALQQAMQARQQAQQAYQFDAGRQLQYDEMGLRAAQQQQALAVNADLEQQRLDAQQAATEASTKRALAGEFGAMARQKAQQTFQLGLSQIEAVDESFRRREITPQQKQDAYRQIEQMLGVSPESLPAMAFEQQQEAAAAEVKQQQAMIASAFAGTEGGLPDVSAFMEPDRDGVPRFSPSLMWSEVKSRRETQVRKELEAMGAQADAVKAKATEDDKQETKVATIASKAYQGFADYQKDLAAWEASEGARGDGTAMAKPIPMHYAGKIPLVSNPADMYKLPPGTPFITPDGQLKRVPQRPFGYSTSGGF